MSKKWLALALLMPALALAAPAKKKPTEKTKAAAKTKKGKKMIAVFETSMGTFKAELYADKAPKTVENFVGLTEGTKDWTDPKSGKKMHKHPLYNGTTFHRIIKGFMIQGGDPLGNGTGGPGYEFADEYNPELKFDGPGILAMANSGPNTNGSQFFVTVANTPWLNKKPDDNHVYTIFGKVIEGMDVVMKISEVKTNVENHPLKEVEIKSVKIERK